jgi:hypothetical protein
MQGGGKAVSRISLRRVDYRSFHNIVLGSMIKARITGSM